MVTPYFSTMRQKRSLSGKSGVPSYMTPVAPLASGPYTMYECPVTHPMSAVHQYTSSSRRSKIIRCVAPAPVRGDDDLRLAIVDAVAQRLRREAAEDHAVRRPDAGARQHGDRQLGDHRHVDGDGVALLDPVLAEGGGQAVHLAIHVPVG